MENAESHVSGCEKSALEREDFQIGLCSGLLGVGFFTTAGSCPGIGSPVSFCNQTRGLKLTLHGDDITALGFEDDLSRLEE